MQEVLGMRVEKGTKIDEAKKAGKMVTKEYGKMLTRMLILEEERVPAEDARGWKIEGLKRSYQEEIQNIAGGI